MAVTDLLLAVVLGFAVRLAACRSVPGPPAGALGAALDCSFSQDYPPQYIAYKTPELPTIDGRLDEPLWAEVGWTDAFQDIQGPALPTPRFETRAKIRWDDTHLYVGARLQEPQIWATLTKHDSVIFYDNDFEVFISPDGSSHYYKEFEMNAFNASWSLCLNKPYLNDGYENSSRVFGDHGWDDPDLQSAVYVDGTINDPTAQNRFWSVEIAFPIKAISINNTNAVPPRVGDYWRVDFSRVEWHVHVVNNTYEKIPNVPEDNWVWAPTYVIDIHLPEYWGYVQFADTAVNASKLVRDPDWTIRHVAMVLYQANADRFALFQRYTSDIVDLSLWASENVLWGNCTLPLTIDVSPNGQTYTGYVSNRQGTRTAVIRSDRLLTVVQAAASPSD